MDVFEPVQTTGGQSIKDQLAKLVLGGIAGFLATKVVEDLYDKFVVERREAKLNTEI